MHSSKNNRQIMDGVEATMLEGADHVGKFKRAIFSESDVKQIHTAALLLHALQNLGYKATDRVTPEEFAKLLENVDFTPREASTRLFGLLDLRGEDCVSVNEIITGLLALPIPDGVDPTVLPKSVGSSDPENLHAGVAFEDAEDIATAAREDAGDVTISASVVPEHLPHSGVADEDVSALDRPESACASPRSRKFSL